MPAILIPAVALRVLASGACLVGCLAGCLSEGQRMPIDAPAGRAPTPQERVRKDVGRLLSGDTRASRDAESALASLDAEGRAALAAHARRIPDERDRRWLNVLESNGLLDVLTPPLSSSETVDWYLWQAQRGEPTVAMKVAERLAEIARREPAPLVARLATPQPGRDLVVLALGTAGAKSALPAIAAIYRGPSSIGERRAAAEAIARILGEARRPRADADDVERASVAAKILREAAVAEGSSHGP